MGDVLQERADSYISSLVSEMLKRKEMQKKVKAFFLNAIYKFTRKFFENLEK